MPPTSARNDAYQQTARTKLAASSPAGQARPTVDAQGASSARSRTSDELSASTLAERAARATASASRRTTDAAALEAKSEALEAKLRATSAVTDVDISDEPAGVARTTLKNASIARRADQEAARQRQNTQHQQRVQQTSARTDDDIADEEAGMARAQMSAASASRRAAEEAERRRQNAEMRRRLLATRAKTDDGDGLLDGGVLVTTGTGDPSSAMGLSARESDVLLSTFRKFECYEENTRVGGSIRSQKSHGAWQRQRDSASHLARGQQLAVPARP